MNLELTPSTLQLFHTTKEQRQEFVHNIVQAIENGETDAIKVHLFIKSMEDLVKRVNDDATYKQYLLDAAERNGKKFTAFNAEFQIKEVGSRYDYSQCNDPEIEELEYQINQLTEKLKGRYKFLQTVPPSGMDIRVGDEMITVYPPSKSSTTSVTVTLK
jgi:hypothetical protein